MDPIATPLFAAAKLESLRISYVLGGSYASSIHGEPRATRDCDFLIDLDPDQVEGLIAAFEGDFYISRRAVDEALTLKRSFNVIHLKTGFKVDMFVSPGRDYDRERLRRGIQLQIGDQSIRVSTAEDTILSKLEWHNLHPSDQQWRDVLGVLLVQAGVDIGYLQFWARELGLTESLDKALREVADGRPG